MATTSSAISSERGKVVTVTIHVDSKGGVERVDPEPFEILRVSMSRCSGKPATRRPISPSTSETTHRSITPSLATRALLRLGAA